MRTPFLLIFIAFSLAGCNFRPLLDVPECPANPQAFHLEMDGDDGYDAYKFEQELRKHLRFIPQQSVKPYFLKVKLKQVQSDITFGRDATVLRSEIEMKASYVLYRYGAEKPLASNTLSGRSSFSIHNEDEYLSVTARQGAQKRSTLLLAEDLAREISFVIRG